MLLEQFIRQFFPFKKNKTHNQVVIPLLKPSKDESERLALAEIETLIASNKFKKALNYINRTIDSGTKTKKILFKKAFLLSHAGQYEEAHEIWLRLSKLSNKPKLAASAKKSLETSKKIQAEYIKKIQILVKSLHSIAKKYQQTLKHLPNPQDVHSEVNILPLIRKEAESARKADIPKLSVDFTEEAIHAGLDSPLLLNDKALSLSMMGRHKTALEILEKLDKKVKNQEIISLIKDSKLKVNEDAASHDSRIIKYLAKQVELSGFVNSVDVKSVLGKPESNKGNIKSLLFKQATINLEKLPNACLGIVNSILDYFPHDGASLQLKSEALIKLKREKEAVEILKDLFQSSHKQTSTKAAGTISKLLSQKAIDIDSKGSPQKAISFFVKEHLKLNLAPALNAPIKSILQKCDPEKTNFSDPELVQHQLQLKFNTIVIDCLEAQLREQGRRSAATPAQKPGPISKTASKAG